MVYKNLTMRAVTFISLLLAVSLLIFSFFSSFLIKEVIELKTKEKGVVLAKNLALNSQYGISEGDIKHLQNLTASMIRGSDVIGCELKDIRGKMLFFSYASGWERGLKQESRMFLPDFDEKEYYVTYSQVNKLEVMKVDVPLWSELEGDMKRSKENIIGLASIYFSMKETALYINKLRILLFLGSIVIISLAFFWVFFWAKSISVPLSELVRGTLEIKHGNLDYDVQIENKDELGELADAFNAMRLDLKNKMAQLGVSKGKIGKLNKKLEQKVLERTKELEETHFKLKEIQENLIHSSKLAVASEMRAKIVEEIAEPLSSLLSFIQKEGVELASSESRGTLLLLKNILLKWQKEFESGNLEAFLAKRKNDEEVGKESFMALSSSLNFLEKREDGLERIFSSLRDNLYKVFNVLSSLKDEDYSTRKIDNLAIDEVFKRVLVAVELKLKKGNISVEEVYADNLPLIQADLIEMNQVFFNMIENSIEALPDTDNPKIRITAQMSAEGKDLLIEITDNGRGVSLEHKDKIFVAGFTTKAIQGAGVGLGLSICRRFIRSYGGEIFLKETAFDKGVTFLVRLPIIDN